MCWLNFNCKTTFILTSYYCHFLRHIWPQARLALPHWLIALRRVAAYCGENDATSNTGSGVNASWHQQPELYVCQSQNMSPTRLLPTRKLEHFDEFTIKPMQYLRALLVQTWFSCCTLQRCHTYLKTNTLFKLNFAKSVKKYRRKSKIITDCGQFLVAVSNSISTLKCVFIFFVTEISIVSKSIYCASCRTARCWWRYIGDTI